MKRIVYAHDEAERAELGGKGWALASAERAGLPVPPWFAVPASAGRADGVVPADLRAEIARALALLAPRGERVAVRSSAADEDGARLSFAGQLETYLFVAPGDVPDRIADVWRSAFSARVQAYRAQHGSAPRVPAVIVQRMVAADAAGVAFSADPVSGRRALRVVAATPGTGAALVDGAQDGDTFHVARSGEIVRRAPAGAAACLDDAQVREVAALARRCASHFGRPQDIEWAIAGGRLWLLQSRPITSLAQRPDPDGAPAIWDSSNIAESYGGVTTPLTFSFIRRCYEHVYRELSRLGGVPESIIRASDDAYRRMLGLVRGRVYYDLIAWYRLLALAPGFRFNRHFLDDMLGVRERPDLARLLPRPAAGGLAAVSETWALARVLAKAAWRGLTLRRIKQRYLARLDRALAGDGAALEDLRADELAAQYRTLERQLLAGWDAPLVNDFFAMIFHGLLRRLVGRWLPPADAGIENALLSGDSGVISLEPVRRIRAMAAAAAGEPGLAEALRDGSRDAALAGLQHAPRVHRLYLDYLERFADRCPEELKLESITLDEEPLPLLRAVGYLAAAGPRAADDAGRSVRTAAEARVAAVLSAQPWRRVVFGWVLGLARARVRDRENLRFERTRVFARVRRLVVELGRRLHEADRLDDARDVFYLELEEVLAYVAGTATTTDLRALCAARKAEFERHRRAAAPPRRFETRGIAQIELGLVAPPAPAAEAPGADARRGTGCSPGVVRGRARVVAAAQAARLQPGEILVAERTDPGWVTLFASAAGLVVERGSLLSHAAIVAREMGLPAVVGVAGACAWLQDGDAVEIDGAAGTVRRVAPTEPLPCPA